jgi:hypothetical protein
LQEGDQSVNILELKGDCTDVIAILTDEALAGLITHIRRDSRAVAV